MKADTLIDLWKVRNFLRRKLEAKLDRYFKKRKNDIPNYKSF